MKILILSPYLPWPPYGGNVMRVFGVLKELARREHEITLLAGHAGPPLGDSPLASLCSRIEFYRPPPTAGLAQLWLSRMRTVLSPYPYSAARFGSNEARRAIQRILVEERFDLILANFAFLADSTPRKLARGAPVVLDEHESEGLLWRQFWHRGSVPLRVFGLLNLIKLAWFQKRLSRRIDLLLCASERETEFARRGLPARVQVLTLPNGLDADFYPPPPALRKTPPAIIICGGWGVYRNRQAALWFAREMFPAIRQAVPAAEFWIVGRDPNREILDLARTPGIQVTGLVEDVRPYYARAAVAVAPYQYGEGTRLKVIEAMAAGVPLVATANGCQGLDVVHGEHVILAGSAEEFARHVIRLLGDESARARLAAAARRKFEEKYTWEKIVGGLEPRLRELASAVPGSP